VPECSTRGTTECQLNQPIDVKVGGTQDLPSVRSTTQLFVADRQNDVVLMTRDGGPDGLIARAVGSGTRGYSEEISGPGTTMFDRPTALAYDSLGQRLYIADAGNSRVRVYSLAADWVAPYVGTGTGKVLDSDSYLTPANGVAADATPLNFPIGLAYQPSGQSWEGSLFLSAVWENQIRVVGGPA
jgi:DNA-binding beta-propeller fold protein YncE